MFLSSRIISFLALLSLVFSLQIHLTPKQRNVTRGEVAGFNYLPSDQKYTNVTVLDSLNNVSIHVIDNVKGGHVNWTVSDTLEVRGGYFYVVKQWVNNATIAVASDSEFQVLEKQKPKPSSPPENKNSSAMSRPVGNVGLALLSGFVVVLCILDM